MMRIRLFILVIALSIISIAVSAHTPINMVMTPDFDNNKATLKIHHPIAGSSDHHLKKVEVIIDEAKPSYYHFTFQKGDFQMLDISVPDFKKVKTLTIRACHDTCLEKTFDISGMVGNLTTTSDK